jgi:hypothetical protein
VDAVEGEDEHDGEVGDEEPEVEGCELVEVLEGAVGVVSFEVVGEALGGERQGEGLDEDGGV